MALGFGFVVVFAIAKNVNGSGIWILDVIRDLGEKPERFNGQKLTP